MKVHAIKSSLLWKLLAVLSVLPLSSLLQIKAVAEELPAEFYPPPNGLHGTLVYMSEHGEQAARRQECGLHHYSNRRGNYGDKSIVDVTFTFPPLQAPLAHPQISPDGHRVLFWVLPGGDDYSSLGLLDLETRMFQMVPQSHYCIWSSWSPDGHAVAYIWGNLFSVGSSPLTDSIYLQLWGWRTGKEKIINANSTLDYGGAAWLSTSAMLFSVIPQGTGQKPQRNDNIKLPTVPCIYKESVTGPPKLLVQNAWNPIPSPDGKWLAFFRWKHQPQLSDYYLRSWEAKENDLCISRMDGTQRQTIKLALDIAPSPAYFTPSIHSNPLMWLPNSKQFIIFDTTNPGQAVIHKCDVATGHSRMLATMQAQTAPPRDPYFQQWSWQHLSADGKFLFVLFHEFPSTPDLRTSILNAVDLNNGSISKLAVFHGWADVDWHDE